MGKTVSEFCDYLNSMVGRGLYVLGGQGESLYGLAQDFVLSMEKRYGQNPEKNTARVMTQLKEKLPENLYFYDCSGLGVKWLLEQGLINEASFSYEYFEGSGYAAVIFSGESKDPDAVAKAVREEADRLRREGIDPLAFERARKALYGRNVAALNSAENIANSMIALTFADRELFSYIDAIVGAKLEDVQKRLDTCLLPEYSTLSVVLPHEKAAEPDKE